MILIYALLALVSAAMYWDNWWIGLLFFSIVGALAYSGNGATIHSIVNNKQGGSK